MREWPFIGREHELEQIARVRAAGRAGAVVVAGPGVGKSALARAALAQAEREGALALWVQATRSAATVPMGAFAGVIPVEVRSDDVLELLRGSAAALVELAGHRPLIVGVDDAQLLDPVSAALALHLASATSTFVLATVRTGEPCPDAVVSLWKDAAAERLELDVLGESDTAALVEGIVSGPVEQGARRWVWETSRGNALYARELVVGALDGGAFHEVGGLWRMSKQPPLNRSLGELISARLSSLEASDRRVLEFLALGEPLAVEDLFELAGRESTYNVEDRGLITVSATRVDQTASLAHPLYGEAIRASLPSLRSRDLTLALAERLQAHAHLSPRDSLRVCRWRFDAGAPIPNELLLDAGKAASERGDPDLGAELAESALGSGGGAAAGLLLARCHQARKRFEDAEAVLADLENELSSQDVAVEYLNRRVDVLYWGLQRPDEAEALLVRALDWWHDEKWVRRLLPIRLQLSSLVEGSASAVTMSAVLLYDEAPDAGVRRDLEVGHAMSLFATGRVLQARELLRHLRPQLPLTGHSDELALVGLGVVEVHSGVDLAQIEREMAHTLTEAVRLGDHAAVGVAAMVVGTVANIAGRYRDATRWLSEAELHYEQQDTFGVLVIARQALVGVVRQTGNADRTIETARRCLNTLEGRDPLPSQVPYVARARAWEAEARGDLITAQRILLDTADELADDPLYRALMFYEAMRVGAPARPLAAAIDAMRSRCDAPLVSLYIDHVEALARGNGHALIKVSDGFAHLGALRYATEAAAHASAAFMNGGRQDSARRAVARARELFIDGQGGVMPAVAALDGSPVDLTSREAQLVELARQGLSNAQIAERLVLSIRTVESHLHRAMQKLGVSDRHDL